MQMANSEVATAVSLLQQLHGELSTCVAALNAVHGSGGLIEAQPVEGVAHVKASQASASDAAAAGSRSASPAARPSGDESDGETTAHQHTGVQQDKAGAAYHGTAVLPVSQHDLLS